MKRKKEIIIIGILLIGIFVINYVSAYKLVCLTYGQSLPNGYTCNHDQCLNLCVTDTNFPTNPGFCKDMGGCEFLGETPGLDVTPPALNVNSPDNEEVFNSRAVLFDLTFNEPSSIYYLDNINGRGSWKKICSNCEDSYLKSLSFKDGENDITIKATDRNGNSAEVARTFFVDSKKPRINKVLPNGKFADGLFEVQYSEENLEKVELTYGNDITGEVTVPLVGCLSGVKQWCNINVDLSAYNEQEIYYSFKVTDISGNEKESKPRKINIDTSFPVLNNPDSFWTQGEGKNSKYIYFKFDVTELNLDGISFIDYSDTKPKLIKICSKLDKLGICEAKKSFRKGYHHVLDIQVLDKAGNLISIPTIEFDVDY